jgi:DNA-binding MarR family transcriptional regulator
MDLRLEQEIRQKAPVRSLEQEAMLNIVRTAAVLNDFLELVLRPFGLSMAQYNVLRILRGAEPDALCRNDIRDRMVTRMPDMTRLLDRMEESGLVDRTRETGDRRMVLTRLTDRSRQMLTEIDPLVGAEHQRRFLNLDKDELQSLVELLTAVRNQG